MVFQNWRMAPCPDLKGSPRPKMSLELALAKTDGWPPVPISKAPPGPKCAAAGALAGFMGFQNWRMAPGPDLKGSARPKMSLELALAMLRLVPSLVLWDFKTDGWPPVPISKVPPGPKCRWSIKDGNIFIRKVLGDLDQSNWLSNL